MLQKINLSIVYKGEKSISWVKRKERREEGRKEKKEERRAKNLR